MNTELKNLYSILGVASSASKAAIKAAYRSLAKKYHPDMNKGNKSSEEKFKEITYAYEILSDDEKIKNYDKINGFNQPKKQANPYSNAKKVQENYQKQSFNKNSKKTSSQNKSKENHFEENFSWFVKEFFTSQEKTSLPQKGKDIYTDLIISLFEAQTGTTRRVNILYSQSCPSCHGKSFINGSKCKKCNGLGEISIHKTIPVKIPAGIQQGEIITLKGEGNRGKDGGENGDLHLKINIEQDKSFRFEGLNVISDIPITPTEAALGATIQISSIDGIINMKIPPETSSGQKFRLHGQGIFDKENNKKGDHIVTVFIKMPKNLSPQEKELYNKLAKIRNFNPREE